MREQGKFGKVIKAVLGVHAERNHKDGLVMDSLRRTSWEVIRDLALIHQDITVAFREHYKMPLDFVNEMHRASDWQQYAEDKEVFTHVYRDFIIPLWFIDIFCQALQLQPKAAATESKLQELLGDQPTLAGFKAGIKDAKTNSGPSMSRMSGLPTKSLKSCRTLRLNTTSRALSSSG